MNPILFTVTDATVKVPLYPWLKVPSVFTESLTLRIITLSPTSKLWGSSVLIVDVVVEWEQSAINLGFLSNSKSFSAIVFNVKSLCCLTPVVLDSWIINPSSGFFPFTSSFGITTLSL